MPLIDLKDVSIYFEDGTLMTGAVKNMAGYAANAVTMTVDGFTDQVPVGSRLSIDGDDRYTVVSTTETLGATTSITFTPGLAASVSDDDVVIAYGVFVRAKVGEGSLTWDEKRPMEYKKDRGKLDLVRLADEEPMDVNFTFSYTELTAADPMTDPPTIEDVLKHRGAAASWISADQRDSCTPFCVNIRLDWQPPGCPAFKTERVVLPYYYYESLNHDPKAGTITTSGKCNATEAIVTRYTAHLTGQP